MRGDLLVVEGNGSSSQIGRAAVWDGSIDRCVHQNHLIRVRPGARLIPEYLGYVWNAPQTRDVLTRMASSTSGLYTLSVAKLQRVQVPVPPLDEQRRIVDLLEDHLSRLDAARYALQAASGRLLGLRLAVLLRAVSRFRDSRTEFRPLGHIAETALGKMLDRKRAIGTPTPYLRNINVRWGHVDTSDVKTVPLSEAERKSLALEPGDLLVCEGGEPGRCAVWPGTDELMAFQKALHRVRVRPDVLLPEFVAAMVEVSVRTGGARRLLTGTTIKHLPQERLRELRLPVPELQEQEQLIAELRGIEGESTRLRAALELGEARGQSLRRGLLDAAFTGRLTGPVSDLDLVEELVGAAQ